MMNFDPTPTPEYICKENESGIAYCYSGVQPTNIVLTDFTVRSGIDVNFFALMVITWILLVFFRKVSYLN